MVKLQSDNTCLNILTEDFPNGEIRGQVRKSLSCDEISGIYDPIVSNLSLFPNPATETISLEFFAERSTHSSIEILDLTGKPVEVFNRHFSAGEQSLPIDLKAFSRAVCAPLLDGGGDVGAEVFKDVVTNSVSNPTLL
ncbi:MAG: CHRD domain-containing protein [Saprospirales bacterium]|nr:CHRD domain-containing protein [Saprospirales bacterium]